MMAVLHDKEYREEDVDVAVQATVQDYYTDTQNVRFRTVLAVTVASTTFKGSCSQFSAVYASLAAWIPANGYELCGPMMDIYYVSPNETRNPDEFITEVCCPLKKV